MFLRYSARHSCFQGQPVADSIADKIEMTTTYGKFKRLQNADDVVLNTRVIRMNANAWSSDCCPTSESGFPFKYL
ncbi:hypothetical protein Tco_0324911 [Tanacetum coccineum]